jgi:hypothetical protein
MNIFEIGQYSANLKGLRLTFLKHMQQLFGVPVEHTECLLY